MADAKEKEPHESEDRLLANGHTINCMNPEEITAVAHYEKDPETQIERVKFQGIGDNDSIDSLDDSKQELPPIPDGGWGWVVVIASFIVAACADGLAFSFGLLHKEFTDYFKTTQSETSMIGSLFIATPLLVGPIMSALVDRYGCRVMTMIAGVVSCLGFLLASISNSVATLCLTFGFISGIGLGIMYVTGVVSVAFWFDKRRNLAVSLASCGIGFGTMIYSPMTHYFLQVYDWRNTVVLLAGTLLNMCVCGALMRNPDWLRIKMKREREQARSRRSSSAGSISSRSVGGDSIFLGADELKDLLQSGQSPEYILATLVSNIAEAEELEATTQMNAEQTCKRMHSAIHLPTFIQQNEKVPPEVIENLMQNKRLYNIILQNYPHLITRTRSEANLNVETPPIAGANEPAQLQLEIKARKPKISESHSHKDNVEDKPILARANSHAKSQEVNKSDNNIKSKENINKSSNQVNKSSTNMNSKDKDKKKPNQSQLTSNLNWFKQINTNHHYLKDMPLYRNTMMHRGAMMSISRYKLRASSLPDMYRNSMYSLDSESDDEMRWYDRLWLTLKKSFDFKMFSEFHFLIFNLSSVILSVWFIVPYLFLNSYMIEMHVAGEEMMIAIIGVSSSIGIVALGWAGDQPWINVSKTYAICLIICGFSVAAYPLAISNYWCTAVTSSVFGISFASSYSYTPAILMELMPIEKFTVAYGLILLSQGIGHLVGPPIGGMLYDITGSWELTFYFGGFWIVISGLCVGVIAYTKNRRICGNSPLLNDTVESKSERSSA